MSPIVNGAYEARLSTRFPSVEEGLDALRDKIRRARKIRISNVPGFLVEELAPLLDNKDLMLILPRGEEPSDRLTGLGDIAVSKSRIFVDLGGREVESGTFSFSDRTFSVLWTGDEIVEVATMDYSKCAKCMLETFDMGWRYSRKLGH